MGNLDENPGLKLKTKLLNLQTEQAYSANQL